MNILALSEGDARLFIEIIDSVCSSRAHFGAYSFILFLDIKALHVAQLEPQLRHLAFAVLTRLCGKIGYLPESYLLSDKFDLSGMPHTSGGFSDVRKCVQRKGRCGKVFEGLRSVQQNESSQGRKLNCIFSSGLAHTPYRTFVKKLSCGRT